MNAITITIQPSNKILGSKYKVIDDLVKGFNFKESKTERIIINFDDRVFVGIIQYPKSSEGSFSDYNKLQTHMLQFGLGPIFEKVKLGPYEYQGFSFAKTQADINNFLDLTLSVDTFLEKHFQKRY